MAREAAAAVPASLAATLPAIGATAGQAASASAALLAKGVGQSLAWAKWKLAAALAGLGATVAAAPLVWTLITPKEDPMLSRNQMLGALVVATGLSGAPAAEPQAIADQDFANLAKLIKPGPGESRWQEIDWLTSIHDARVKAAAEGKPIVLWSGGGAPPLGGC
jgi:hypothetical protein